MIWLLLLLPLLPLFFPAPFVKLLARKKLEHTFILPKGVTVRVYPKWALKLVPNNAHATTIGDVILMSQDWWNAQTREQQRATLRHEVVHVKQAETWGPLYLPVYIILYIRHGYKNHPWEKEATH